MNMTLDAILGMAPDAASVKAARGLVAPGKWPELGFDDAAVWGACQGSGAKPYQVRIDLAGAAPVCACSCPSRKIPCKHALALLMLRAQHASIFTGKERPAWVEEWLSARRQRAAAKAGPNAGRREAARLARIRDGLDELERWMLDQTRHGFASLSGDYDVWDKLAARMVDAQAPGVAARLRALNGIVDRREDWPAVLLARLGTLQLLIDAFRRMDSLSPGERADLRVALGIAPDRDEVEAGPDRVTDLWLTLGVSHAEEDRLWRRRVWLYGQDSGRLALLLDFSHGSRQFEHPFAPGDRARMTLAFYPGSAPLRALVVGTPEPAEALPSPVPQSGMRLALPLALPLALDDGFLRVARALAVNPWQLPLPLIFSGARLCRRDGSWLLLADAGHVLPLDMTDAEAWELLAASGGHPLLTCGEWDGVRLRIAGAFGQPESMSGKRRV